MNIFSKFSLLIIVPGSVFAQIFPCQQNDGPNPNYCCGHDPEYTSQNNDHSVYSWGNLCDWSQYDQAKNPTVSYNTGQWMLIWNDEFNHYTQLDESFYRPVSQVADNIHYSSGWSPYNPANPQPFLYMQDPSLLKINQNGNGKLQLYENYNSNSSQLTQLYEWGDPTSTFIHSDYTVGHLETRFRFPQNCRVQADIKVYPVVPTQWPSFWMYGDRGLEIDIFEIPYSPSNSSGMAPSAYSNLYTIMTYHGTKYGLNGNAHRLVEAAKHVSNSYVYSYDVFRKYELVWDDWITQWAINNNAIHTINRFYKLNSNWNSNKRKKNYRKYPVNNSSSFYSHTDQLFANNTYFPGFFDFDPVPLYIIFNNQLTDQNTPLSPAYIDPSKSMDMDYLKVWVKSACSSDRNITSTNVKITYPGQFINNSWIKRNYLETGANVNFINNNNVTILESQLALLVATNQISFENGFSVDPGANLFAFISYCEPVVSLREDHNPSEDDGDDGDQTPYYLPNGSIDTTDLIALENGHGGENNSRRLQNTNGILETQNDASANDPYIRGSIIIKTESSGLTIVSSGGNITGIELLDSKAALVLKESNLEQKNYKIPREKLTEGLYSCLIYTTSGIDVRKIWVW